MLSNIDIELQWMGLKKGYVNWNWETNVYNQLIILCDVISLGFSCLSEFEVYMLEESTQFLIVYDLVCVTGCHVSAEAAYSCSPWSKESFPLSKLFFTQVLKRLEIFWGEWLWMQELEVQNPTADPINSPLFSGNWALLYTAAINGAPANWNKAVLFIDKMRHT